MPDFLRDTFAVSGPLALESHTPDVGGAWSTAQTAGSVIITTSSHECRPLAPTNPTDANQATTDLKTSHDTYVGIIDTVLNPAPAH